MYTTKWIPTLVVFVVSCFLSASVWAQSTLEDVIYLKNGSILRGQVLAYDPNANIKIKIKGGSILVYESSEVLKIEKEEVEQTPEDYPNPNVREVPLNAVEKPAEEAEVEVEVWEQHIPERGFYGTLAVGNIFPSPNLNMVPIPGLKLDAAIGYRAHHLFSIGAGIGGLLDFSQSFVYGYGSIRGDILNKSFSPYYEINVGYGLPLSRNSIAFQNNGIQEITEMRGGLYFRPSIGMRFGSRNSIHTFVDIGLYYQSVYYAGRTWNNFSYVEQYIYMRPSIRVGMLF